MNLNLPGLSLAKRKITLYRKRSVETFGAHYVSYAQVLQTVGILGKRCYVPQNWRHVNEMSSNGTDDTDFYEEKKNDTIAKKDEHYFYDFRDEWLLFHNKEYVCFWFIVAYSSGHFFGSLLGGHLSDNLGRLWATFPTLSVTLVCGVLSVTCNDWTMMMAFQAVIGLLVGKMETCAMVFLSEITDAEYRILPLACTSGSLATLLVTLLSFLTRHWRYYLIFLNLICAPLLYMFLLLQESPRWLIAKGRNRRAANVLSEMGSELWTDEPTEVNVNQLSLLPKEMDEHKVYTIFCLFSKRSVAGKTVFLIWCCFAHNTISMATFSDSRIGEIGVMSHSSLYGILTLCVVALLVCADFKIKSISHRQIMAFALATEIILLSSIVAILHLQSSNNHSLPIVLVALFAAAINDGLCLVMLLHIVATAYPTVARALGYGLFIAVKDVSNIAIILLLGYCETQYIGSYEIAAVCTLITLVLCVWLQPEAKYCITGRFLPDFFYECT
uniref:Major facilitator superfamily (MFS) profile domain-containing protein n=1 Tax=Trichuris muris TaxID=70415 RepID=A0A5S6Q853_TRIMR